MTLAQFLDQFDGPDRTIVVVNRTDPDPVLNMLVDTFGESAVDVVSGTMRTVDDSNAEQNERADGGQSGHNPGELSDYEDGLATGELTTERIDCRTDDPVGPTADEEGGRVADDGGGQVSAAGGNRPVIDVEALRQHDDVPFEGDDPETLENLTLLIEEDRVIAGSTLDELSQVLLLVNSDLYVTGSRPLSEVELPSVVSGLTDTAFSLRGYPESNRQKLLLITISRFIERAAWTAGSGTLRSSFQRLSRLNDEVGTREVYERVPEAGVDTHLYGVADELPTDLDAVIHAGDGPDFTDSWFVAFRPEGGAKPVERDAGSDLERGVEGGVALLAVETEPRTWQGLWTFDADKVASLNRYIERNL